MDVLLIATNTERINLPTLPYGLALVAAAVGAAGHTVRMLDLRRHADPRVAIAAAVAQRAPDVIGLSVRNVDDQCLERPRFFLPDVAGIVRACRAASRAPLVLGGAGYSIFPAAALAYLGADWGVGGEGEAVLPALLCCLERGEDPGALPGVHAAGGRGGTARALADDLDGFPGPAEHLWPAADPGDPDLWLPIQSRRGCPLACSYCSTPGLEGRAIRARSPRLVVQEIVRLARRGYRRFYFVDSIFNLPEDYALELCRRLAHERLDIAWRCILYPGAVSAELAASMRAAGCAEAGLGFESGSAPVLRAMNKPFLPAEVREIAERLAAHGLRRMGFLLLGGPGETQDTVAESLAFAGSLRLEQLRITVGIRIYPGTPLAQTARRDGLIAAEDDLLLPRFYLTPGLSYPAARAV
jgi:radical SAM superfamily enzyme YgiQ (UPF0313 family)